MKILLIEDDIEISDMLRSLFLYIQILAKSVVIVSMSFIDLFIGLA